MPFHILSFAGPAEYARVSGIASHVRGRSHKRYLHGRPDRGTAVAWDLVQTFLAAAFSQDERHLRRLGKVAALEAGSK